MYLFVGRDRTSRPEKFLFNVVINSIYIYIYSFLIFIISKTIEKEKDEGGTV